MLHPDFPVIDGKYPMTKDWSITLPGKFNRRFEAGDLVIWRPGFTIWITVWNNDNGESMDGRLAWLSAESSLHSFDQKIEQEEHLIRYAYHLDEESEDERQPTFYGYAIGANGHVQMASYFDEPEDLSTAEAVWRSLATD